VVCLKQLRTLRRFLRTLKQFEELEELFVSLPWLLSSLESLLLIKIQGIVRYVGNNNQKRFFLQNFRLSLIVVPNIANNSLNLDQE
jgi:hypothetical protein